MDLPHTLPGDLSRGAASDLVELLLRYRLIDAAHREELTGRLQGQFPEPRSLAGELIHLSWLTPYQVNQIFQGKGARLVLGAYVLLERIGEGGMGQVFKARHHNLGAPLECATLSPAGLVLAAGLRNGTVLLWDTNTQMPLGKLTGTTQPISALAFSLDGQLLLAADLDGNITLWDRPTTSKLLSWKVPGSVHGIAFAPDGRHFAIANGNSTVYLFRIKPYNGRQ